MATPTPKATWSSSGPISDGSKMYQHYDSNGNPVGKPYDNSIVRQAPDVGFGPKSPANQIKTHSPSGVLGEAHMGGHSDVAAKPTVKPATKAYKK